LETLNSMMDHDVQSKSPPPPRDRPIMVLSTECRIWLRVQWATDRFAVVGGHGTWVEVDEIQAWREVPHAAIDHLRDAKAP
jgi:hypothetical protein